MNKDEDWRIALEIAMTEYLTDKTIDIIVERARVIYVTNKSPMMLPHSKTTRGLPTGNN